MIKSQCTIFYPLDQINNNYLVYNTLFRTAAIVSGKVKELIEENKYLDKIPPNLKEKLLQMGILVSSKEDDQKRLIDSLNKGRNPDYFFPVIAFTAKCNLKCVYCFEEGIDQSISMTPEVASKTVQWMKDYVSQNGHFSRIHLALFGGEPLLDMENATYFIDETAAIANELGMKFVFNLTTNGVLMKRKTIEEFVKKGLQGIQVTLDGPPSIHNIRRKFKNGKGTFDIILQNILDIADIDKIIITLEVNIDEQDINSFGELLDILAKNGLRDRLRLVPEPTLETMSCIGFKDHHCNKYVLKGKRLTEAYIRILQEISSRGFHIPEVIGVSYPCIFGERHHYVIDFYGNIYKCSFTIGNKDFIVGNVFDGFNWRNKDIISSKNVINACYEKKCSFVPICGGGCRYEAWAKTGSYHSMNCKKEMIETILPLSLKQYFIGHNTHSESIQH